MLHGPVEPEPVNTGGGKVGTVIHLFPFAAKGGCNEVSDSCSGHHGGLSGIC